MSPAEIVAFFSRKKILKDTSKLAGHLVDVVAQLVEIRPREAQEI